MLDFGPVRFFHAFGEGASMKLSSLVVLFACFLIGVLAYGQGVGASGDLTGTVTDPSNAVVVNATVTVTDAQKGIKRPDTTDNQGQYHVLNLQPGSYNVNVEKSGFGTELAKGVVVIIGQTTVMDFRMKVSTATETVEVTSVPPAVETERGHQGN